MEAVQAFIEAWAEAHGESPVSTSQLLELAMTRGLVAFAFAAKSDHAKRVRFGMSLSTLRDRRFGDYRVVQSTDSHKKTRTFRLALSKTGSLK